MPYAKTFGKMFLQFCIHGGKTGKGKKKRVLLYETVKVCHEIWVELEVTLMLSNSFAKEHLDPDTCISLPCN